MSIRLIIDSTTDLNPAISHRFTVVPLTICFGKEEFIDGVTITHKEFYEKLIETDSLPSTSQASPAAFEKVFDEVDAAGDSAVVITLSHKLSGTFQSAVIAADGRENIHLVDSGSTAIGAGILAELALQLVDAGMEAREIALKLLEERKNIRVIALLDTLEYLKRGGRISRTVAFAGSMLAIKPVASIVDGEIILLGKARGSKQGNNLLVSEIEKSGGVDFSRPVLLGYTGLSDLMLRKYISDSAALWQDAADELAVAAIGSVVGTHAGPGAIAAAFFHK